MFLSSLKVFLQKTNAPPADGARKEFLHQSLISRFTAGFGTLLAQVAGFHRAVPSTTLDKVFNFTL